MRPIISWTLRIRRWSTLWWSVGIIAFITLELSVYPSIKSQAKQLNQLIDKLPDTVRSLFGASDLFSPVGYLNSRLFYLLLPLMLSILAIGLGSSLIAREESEHTIELLLARPLSRAKLLLAKLTGGFVVVSVVALVTALAISIGVKIVDLSVPIPYLLFAVFLAMLLAILFGMIAFVITCVGRRGRGSAIAVASLIGLGGYVVASLESDVHWLKWPAKLFPYHYYNPTSVLQGNYAWLTASWLMAFILILGILSWLAFRNRDISA